jgi:hypothetical protein
MPKSTQGTHICGFDHTMTEKLMKARDQQGYSWMVLEPYKLCLVHKTELESRGCLVTVMPGSGFTFRWLVVWDVHPGEERQVIDLSALDEDPTSESSDE